MAPDAALEALKTRAANQGSEEAGDSPLSERLEREREILLVWAREEGVAFSSEAYLPYKLATHGEHHVLHDAYGPLFGHDVVLDRYFKITHAVDSDGGGFALTIGLQYLCGKRTQKFMALPTVRAATPFEYLSRLQLFNRTFTDFIEFEGVIDEPDRTAIVISQPFVPGEASTDEEVAAFWSSAALQSCPV